MSLGFMYLIFALLMGFVTIRLMPDYEITPLAVVIYFMLGVVMAPAIFIFFAGWAVTEFLLMVAHAGRGR